MSGRFSRAEYSIGVLRYWSVGVRHLLAEIGFPESGPTVILPGSRGAKLTSYNPVHRSRLRHVEIQVHSIRERVSRDHVRPVWIPAEFQLADLFTKPLPRTVFQRFRACIFGLSPIRLPIETTPTATSTNNTSDIRLLQALRRYFGSGS